MIEIRGIKYYTYGRYYNPEAAQKRANKLQEKFPDREYTILINMRAVRAFTVAQVKEVKVDWPEDDDLGLGPAPERPSGAILATSTAWADFNHEAAKRESIRRKAQQPLVGLLLEKLNP